MQQEVDLKDLLTEAGGYRVEAYRFIRDGLAHTVRSVHGPDALPPEPEFEVEEFFFEDDDGLDDSRHISGRQLCIGLRDYALDRYGLMARVVLNRWGIRRTEDFGRIVFAMVEAGLMRKTEEDTLHDFENVFDFDEEFVLPGDALHARRQRAQRR